MHTGQVCRLLEWDSEFFGLKIARVTARSLDGSLADAVERWCRKRAVECVYYLSPGDDFRSHRTAWKHGFEFVDVRVTLQREIPGGDSAPADSGTLRRASEEDIPALKAIAGSVFGISRFHADSRFSREKADGLYRVWVEKSCRGYADAVLVAEESGEPAGFATLRVVEDGVGRLELLGVASGQRGRGVGGRLVQGVLEWCRERGLGRVFTITQGCNTAAQRLYQRAGFSPGGVEIWFHRWFRESP